jgi:hypothetical protein
VVALGILLAGQRLDPLVIALGVIRHRRDGPAVKEQPGWHHAQLAGVFGGDPFESRRASVAPAAEGIEEILEFNGLGHSGLLLSKTYVLSRKMEINSVMIDRMLHETSE